MCRSIIETLQQEYKNDDVNNQKTETSFLVAVFCFWCQNIMMIWCESKNNTYKQI